MEFHDGTWNLSRRILPAIAFFGMSRRETAYWVTLLAGAAGAEFDGVQVNSQLRPFMYAVPLTGLSARGQVNSFFFNDMGITAGEADNSFYPLVERFGLPDRDAVWSKDNPKAFGVVMASDLMEAEKLALQRAGFVADVLHLALKAGISHWEDRHGVELLEWNAKHALSTVRLSSWILLREVQEVKGWVRIVDASTASRPVDLEDGSARFRMFLERFAKASIVGDVLSRTNRRQLSKTEEKLILGIQRALHWYAVGSSESEVSDKFLAEWIALEAMLNCITYPGVFDGPRTGVRECVEKSINEAPYPDEANNEPLLKLSPAMLNSRVLAGDWPLATKLGLFAKGFAMTLQEGDIDLVKKLSRLRVSILHSGKYGTKITKAEQRELEYLLERILVAASICAYRELADDQEHTIQLMPLGPEGGAAPILLDGHEVAYEFRLARSETGELEYEYLIDGRIYDKRNSRIMGRS